MIKAQTLDSGRCDLTSVDKLATLRRRQRRVRDKEHHVVIIGVETSVLGNLGTSREDDYCQPSFSRLTSYFRLDDDIRSSGVQPRVPEPVRLDLGSDPNFGRSYSRGIRENIRLGLSCIGLVLQPDVGSIIRRILDRWNAYNAEKSALGDPAHKSRVDRRLTVFSVENEQGRVECTRGLHGLDEVSQASVDLAEGLGQVGSRFQLSVVSVPDISLSLQFTHAFCATETD